jgi:hypothetical protein
MKEVKKHIQKEYIRNADIPKLSPISKIKQEDVL